MMIQCVKCGYKGNTLKFTVFDTDDKNSFYLICPMCGYKKIRIIWSLIDKIRRKLHDWSMWWYNER